MLLAPDGSAVSIPLQRRRSRLGRPHAFWPYFGDDNPSDIGVFVRNALDQLPHATVAEPAMACLDVIDAHGLVVDSVVNIETNRIFGAGPAFAILFCEGPLTL